MADLGVALAVVDEPGHWSESLVADGIARAWLPAPICGDADQDAAAIIAALEHAGVRPDGVFNIWENSVCAAARVAEALGLPGNPRRRRRRAQQDPHPGDVGGSSVCRLHAPYASGPSTSSSPLPRMSASRRS